jgi:hypothetical protein
MGSTQSSTQYNDSTVSSNSMAGTPGTRVPGTLSLDQHDPANENPLDKKSVAPKAMDGPGPVTHGTRTPDHQLSGQSYDEPSNETLYAPAFDELNTRYGKGSCSSARDPFWASSYNEDCFLVSNRDMLAHNGFLRCEWSKPRGGKVVAYGLNGKLFKVFGDE